MTFTHVADASDDDESWNEENLEEMWEEEDELFQAEDEEDDLWMEEET